MRINLTSIKENQKIDEISRIVEEAFSKTEYKAKVIPCNYEKNIEKIKQYHRSYYIKNKDKIKQYHHEYNQKKREKANAKEDKSKNNAEIKTKK